MTTPQQWRVKLGLDDLERKNFLDHGFLTAVLTQESNGKQNAVSGAGAGGLFQFMPKTADGYGIDRFDPQESANGAAHMYADLRKKYDGDLNKMLAAYNWGQGNVDKAIAAANQERKETGRPVDWQYKLPKETKDYIKRIRGIMATQSSAEGNYEEASNYASGTDSAALNEYSAKNRLKIGKPRNIQEDEDDQALLLQKRIQEDPVGGLFLAILLMMSGAISPASMNGLMGEFDKLPPEKRQAAQVDIDKLFDEKKEMYYSYYSVRHLSELSKGLTANTAAGRTAELAERFIGQAEEGKNCGAIVQLSGVEQGQPWCGGFANYVFGATMPNVYKGENFNLAISFKEYGEKYNAYHQKDDANYTPEVGDAIVFSRKGGSGHVGIVTKVENGEVTYISGNDGDKVDKDSFAIAKPPENLLGFTSSRQIAEKKGIHFDKQASMEVPADPIKVAYAQYKQPVQAEVPSEQGEKLGFEHLSSLVPQMVSAKNNIPSLAAMART